MSESRSQDPAWPAATSAAAEDGLAQLRDEIDAVDREILARLNQRARLVGEVGTVKRQSGTGVYRAARERDLINALAAENAGPFPSIAVPAVFREIISATYALEGEIRVAFLGPAGTFSHVAAREGFGAHASYRPTSTIGDVIEAVVRGEAEHGIVPVENTTEGPVTQTLDALIESEVPIIGERLLRISQHLVSRAAALSDVKRVASHPQPLAQCRGWLDRALPGVPRIETASTAAAALMALEDPETAAIGARMLADDGELQVLASSIEDRRDNTTRFLILGGEPPGPSGTDLTSLAYTVRKAETGALFRLLEPFSEAGVNLTAIHARPLKGTPWEYVFFIDLEGHRNEERVQRACAAAGKLANSYRILGSFPRASVPRSGEVGA